VARKALVNSMWDGALCMVMIALTDTFAVPAALSLNAPAIAIGILASFPLFLGSLGQIFLPPLIDVTKGRKYYVIIAVALQSTFLILCGFSGFFGSKVRAAIFILSFIAASFFGSVLASFWMSWMSDLTPEEMRGRFFAWRNRVLAIVHLSCISVAGVLSRKFTTATAPWLFFCLVFIIAALFRYGSALFLYRQHEEKNIRISARALPENMSNNFLVYALLIGILMGAVSFSGPFFNVWYLRDIGFNYLELSINSISIVAGMVLFLPLWGRLSDHVGPFRVMKMTGVLLSIIPLPFLFIEAPWKIWVCNFYGGVVWSGFNLANFNYLLQRAGKEHPEQHLAVATTLSSFFMFLFGLLGGYCATRVPVIFAWRLQTLFLISMCLRIIIVVLIIILLRPYTIQPVPGGFSSFEPFNSIPGYKTGLIVIRNFKRVFRI